MHGRGACMAGKTAIAVGGMHATGMHSCLHVILVIILVIISGINNRRKSFSDERFQTLLYKLS